MESPCPQLKGMGEDVTGNAARDDGVRYELVTEAGTEYPSESPIRWLRRVLRGRYRLAIGLAALAGCLGALAGWLALPAKYESQGLVRIEKALPAILYPTQEGQAQPDFDAYVAAQVAHLQSRSVVEAAAGSPAMKQAGWPAGPAGVANGEVEERLTVGPHLDQLFRSAEPGPEPRRHDHQRRTQSAASLVSRSPARKASRARSPSPCRFNSKVKPCSYR